MVKGQSSKWMSEFSPLSTLPIDVADFSLQGHCFSILKTGSADLQLSEAFGIKHPSAC